MRLTSWLSEFVTRRVRTNSVTRSKIRTRRQMSQRLEWLEDRALLTAISWTGSTDTDWAKAANWSPNQVPTSADDVTVDGVTNDPILDSSRAIGSLSGAGIINLSTFTLTIGATNNTTDFLGSVSGSGNVTKTGNGSQTLSGSNGYTGTTTVSAGVLSISGSINSSATLAVNGGTLSTTGASKLDNAATVTVAGGTLTIGGADTVGSLAMSSGSIGGSATLTAATYGLSGGTVTGDLGSGTITISGTVALDGAEAGTTVNITAGTLTLGSADRLADGATVTVSGTGILDLSTFTDTVAAFNMSAGSLNGSGTLTATTYGLSGGTVTGKLGSGTLNSSGTVALNGTSAATAVNVTAGTLTLGASSAINSATTIAISGGSLELGAPNQIGDSAGVTVSGTGVLDLNTFSDAVTTFNISAGSLNGSGTLTATSYGLSGGTVSAKLGTGTINSSGTVALNGTAGASAVNVTAGTMTLGASSAINSATAVGISGGSLALGAANQIGDSAVVTVSSTGTLNLNTFSDTVTTFNMSAGSLGGTGTLTATTYGLSGGTVNGNLGTGTINSTGAVALNGTEAATTVDVTAGTLTLGSANRLADGATVAVSGTGVLDLGIFTDTVSIFNLSAGSLNGSGTLTATTYGLSGGTVTGKLGTGTINSSGTVALNGTAGATVVNVTAGALTLGSSSAINSATTVGISGGSLTLGASNQIGNATVTVSGGTLALGGNSDSVSAFNISSGSLTGTGTLTATTYGLSGGTVGGNLGTGTITSTGTVALNGTEAATTVNITSGTLTLGSSDRLADGATVSVSGTGILDLSTFNDTVAAFNLGVGSLNGTGTLTATTYGLTGGTVTGNLGTGTINSSGTVALNGTEAATAVNITAGTLTLGSPNRLADGATVSVSGGTLAMGGNTDTVSIFNMSIGSITGTGPLTATTYGLSGGTVAGNLGTGTINSTGTVALNGTAAATAVNVTAGTLTLGAADRLADGATVAVSGSGILNLNNFTDTVTTFNMSAGSLNGTGTLTATTYGLSGGTVTGNLGTGTINSSGTVALNGTAAVTAVNITAGTLTLGGTNRLTGGATVTVSGGGILDLLANSNAVGAVVLTSGSITGSSGVLTSSTAYDVQSGSISAILGGGVGLTKSTSGTVTLSRTNTYSGTTTISAGSLTLSNGSAIVDTGAVNLTVSGATLTLNSSETIGNLTGVAGTTVALGGSTLTTGDASNTTFAGGISGVSSSLTKQGAGKFTLSGNNTYSGTTTISGGTLALSGAFANNISSSTLIDVQSGMTLDTTGLTSGRIDLASGQKLEGKGTVTGGVKALSGATLAPGESIGVISTGNLTLASGSTYAVELATPYNTAGTGYDQTNVTGTVDVTGATLSLIGGSVAGTAGQVLTIINNDGSDAVTGTFSGLAEGATVTSSSFTAIISYHGGDGNDVTLTVAGAVTYTGSGTLAVQEVTLSGNDYIQYLVGGVVTDQRLSSTVTSIQVNGGAGNDTLTVNYSASGGIFSKPVTFDGQGQSGVPGDKLIISGGAFTNISNTLSTANNGAVNLDGTVVTYLGLEPVLINVGSVSNMSFTMPAGGNTAFLEDDGTLANGIIQLRSSPVTFEVTSFTVPASSLTITGGSGDDSLSITAITDFHASLTVDGSTGAADVITLSNAISLGSASSNGNLSFTAETVNVGANINTDAGTNSGTVTLSATTVNVTTGVTIDTNNATGTDGALSVPGAIAAAGQTLTLDVGPTNNVTLNNAGNNFGTVAVTTGNNVSLRDTDGIILGTSTANGTFGVTAGGTITQTGVISATTLTTSSVGGTNLSTSANTVTGFNATNITSGNISLTNTTGTLTVSGISQSGGGDVSVTNTGALTTSGVISTAANGQINLQATTGVLTVGAAVTAGGSGTVGLTSTGGTNAVQVQGAVTSTSGQITVHAAGQILESGAGTFGTTGALSTTSVGGQTLNLANTVGNFSATNTSSGNVILTNTATTLTVSSISQSGGGTVSVTNTGALTNSGTISTAANGNITLQATTGALTVASAVTAGGSGTIQLTSTGAGNVVNLQAAVSSTSGAITVNAGGAISETVSGSFGTTGLLTTSSTTGQSLVNVNTVGSFNATNSTSGAVSLINTATTLTVTGITQSGTAAGSNVSVTNTGALTTSTGTISTTATANGTIALQATTGVLTVGTAVTAGGSGTIGLTSTGGTNSVLVQAAVTSTSGQITVNAAGAVTESGGGRFGTSGLLSSTSTTGQTLGGANTVGSYNAANSTSGDISLTNTVATLTVTGISETSGNVSVNNSGALTTSGGITTAANGTISLTASGTETLGAVVTAGGSGTVTLAANGGASDILVNATVSSTSGAIGATAGRNVTLNAGSVTTSGAVTLTGTAGTVSEAAAGVISGGVLTTSSVGGTSLTTANTVTSFHATNTTSGNIALTNTAAPLTTTGISQSAGNVTLTNTGGITFGSTTTVSANLIAVASGLISDTGTLAITGTTSLTAGAGNNITLDGADNFGGSVTVVSGSAVTLNDTSSIDIAAATVSNTLTITAVTTITDSGNISVTNNASFSGTAITLGDAGGETTNFGSLTFSGTGAVSISEDSSMTVSGASTAGAGLTLVSVDDVNLNATVNVTGTTTITAGTTTGGITVAAKLTGSASILLDAADEITVNAAIDPTTVTLQADDDITISAAVTATTTITVQAGLDGSGNAIVAAGGSLVTSAGGSTISISSGNTSGSISLASTVTAVTQLTLTSNAAGGGVSQTAGTVTAANLRLLGANGAFSLTQATNDFGTVAAALDGGSINLRDANSITVGTVTTVGIDTGSTVNGGSVTINATSGTITVSNVIDTSTGTGGAISITGSVLVSAAITAAGGNVTLNGNAAANSDLTINAALSSSVSMTLSATRDIFVGAVVQTTGAGADITLTADSDATGNGGVEVQLAGQVVAIDQVTITGSDVNAIGGADSVDIDADGTNVQVQGGGAILLTSSAAAPAGADIVMNGLINGTGAGTVTITASHSVTSTLTGDITTAGGLVSVTADNATAGNTGGAITQADGVVINAGSGTITLLADGNITLGSATTTNATLTAVTITSTSGGVLDGGDSNVNIVADSGRAVVTAVTGIGAANAIETTVGSLDASVMAAGNLSIAETNAIDLFDVDTANGSITVTAAGTITATDVASTTDADANDISLTTTAGGNILVALVNAGTTAGDVTLTSAGAIDETAADGTADIIGQDLLLLAQSGIGIAPSKIEINGVNLAASTVTGDISLNDTAGGLVITTIGATVGVRITGGGVGDNIDISTSSPLTVNSPVSDAGGGDITLAANGATATDDLTVNADVTASGGNGNIFLYAGDAISLSTTTDVVAAGSGAVLLSAGTNYNNGGVLANGTNAGVITMGDGSTVQSTTGSLTLVAPGNVLLSSVSTAGNVVVTADYDGVTGGLLDNAGTISDNTAAEAANITANQAMLTAATGIGSTASLATDIDTTITTLIATNKTSGDIVIRETDTLIVGGTGVLTQGGNGNVDLFLTLGSLTLNGPVSTNGTGDTRLIAATSVSQIAAGVITTDQFGIRAGGNVNLFVATTNDVNDLAISTTGLIEFRDQDNFNVTTVAADPTGAFAATSGVASANNDIYLETNTGTGTLQILQPINAGGADLRLEASAEVTQTAAIASAGLSLTDTGPFTLTLATNAVTTLAANTNSTINYVDSNSLVIGAVTVNTTSTTNTTTGITTTADDVRLKATVGSFTITNNINLNSGGAGGAGGSLELTATTGATQVGSIKAFGLALRGVGATINANRYILSNSTAGTANDVARIAGLMTNGHVEYIDLNNLDVDDVTVTTGTAAPVAVTTTGIAVGNPDPSVDVDPDAPGVGGGDVTMRAGITFANVILTANSILNVTVANPISTQSSPADFANVNGGDVLIGGGVVLNAALTLGSGDIDLGGSGADICIDTATVITLAPPGSTATLQPIGNIIVEEPLSTIGGDLTLNADADNNGTGGVWVLSNGSIDADGALFVYGSELTASSCPTAAVPTVGIQIEDTSAVTEINANSSIVLETKTNAVAGGSDDDVILNGDVHSDGTGPISIAAENRIVQNSASSVSLTTAGNIYYQANDMVIDTTSAIINAQAAGIVHLRNRSAGLPINVGTVASTASGVVATTLGISNAELNRISTVSAVRIGFNSSFASSPNSPNVLTAAGNAGTITITAANINVLNSTVLHLITGTNIVDDGTGGVGTITETNLALEAVTGIDLDNVNAVPGVSGNDVDNLAIRLTGVAAANDGTFKDVDDLNFAIVDSVVTPEAVNVVGDLTIIAGGAVTQSAAIVTGGLELIDLFNDPNPPLTFLAFPNYYLPNSSNQIGRLEAYSQRSVNITNSIALAVDVVANNFRTFPASGASGVWVQSLLLTAPTVTVNSPIETNDELGFVTFDVTTLLDINANIFSRGKIEQIGTGVVTVADVELRTTDDNITFLGGVTLDGASLVTPTTMSTDASWTTPFTGIPLAANAAATTGGGNIVFNSTLRSNPSGDTAAAFRGNDLTLETGTGNIQFIGQVGGASGAAGRLGVVNIVDAHDVTASTGFSANAIYQQAGDGETAFNGFVQTNGRRDVLTPAAATNFGVDITTKMITLNAGMTTTSAPGSGAAAAIRLNNSGTLSIVAGAGSINSDGAVSQVGTGNNLVGGDIVTTNDNISFASDTYLSGSPIQINSQNADVSFAARFQINNKTVTIRDKDFVDLGTVTAIAGGILNVFVANTATRGSIQAGSGETITGAGTMNTDVSVLTGGTLAPAMDASGLGTGILTVNGNVVLAANAVYAIDLNGTVAGSSYDQVVTGATFTFTSTGAILSATRPVSFNPATGSVLTVIDGSVDVVGNFANAANGTYVYINGLYFRVDYDVTAGDLTLTRLDPPGAAVTIIDDNGSSPNTPVTGFTLSPNNTTAWSPNSVAGRGYANDLRFASPGTGSSTALYTFTGLIAGHTYRVSTTWFPHINRATDSPFTVDDGAGGSAAVTTTINQRNSPDDFTSAGSAWEDLVVGGYTISSTTLTVLLTNNTSTGYVIADAVRIEDVTGAAPEIVVTESGNDIADGTGVVDFGTTSTVGADITKTISIKNTGLSPLVLSSATITPPPGFSISGYTPQTIAPGATGTPFTITLSHLVAGNYSGQILFNTNDFDENPFNFTVKGGVTSGATLIADNLAAGTGYNTITGAANNAGTNLMYGEVGLWHNNDDSKVGYLQDLRYAAANSNSQASWTFSGLATGTYRVSVTFRAESNRASNASFTVTGTGVASPTTIQINQRVAPNQFQDANVYWIDLAPAFGTISAGGTITVTLDALGSNGFVIADAVRVEFLHPLQAEEGPAADPTGTVLTAADLDATAAAAVARWQQASLTAAQQSALNGITFAIADLPDAYLGSETDETIFIDSNAAGYGWYVDTTPYDDAEFGLTIASTELGATDPLAANEMDLLTVLMHEIGHRLGLDDVALTDDAHGLMAESIEVGTRRLPIAAAVSEGDVADDCDESSDPIDNDVSDEVFYTLGGTNNPAPTTAVPTIMFGGTSGAAHENHHGSGHSAGGETAGHRHHHRTGGKPHDDGAPGSRSLLGALFNFVRNRK